MTTTISPSDADTLVWERMDAAARERYRREHGGMGPPGYRGTGKVEWFAPWHPAEAPCCKCGAVTDRWAIGSMYIGTVPFAGATYNGHAFCAETFYAFCWSCERRAAIAVLERRQHNPALEPTLLAGEAMYLAALGAEEQSEAVHAGVAQQ